jgi:hypothetical protein
VAAAEGILMGNLFRHGGDRREPAKGASAPVGAIPEEPLIADAREHGLVGDGVTNDQPALAALVDALGMACAADGLRRILYCPPGVYSIRDAGTVWRSGVSLIGAGPGVTRFVLANPGNPIDPTPLAYFTAIEHGAGRDNHLADCTFASFEIDGSGVCMEHYDVLAKGLGLQYVLRGRFRDLYIHDTAATGFGCDFLQNSIVDGVLVEGCGRLDRGEDKGGAGFGIGIGGWGITENLTLTSCAAVGNGTSGIFLELQREYWPPPRGISIVGCHAIRNRFGISDWGAEGLVVSACVMSANHLAGYDISGQGTSTVAGRDGIVTGCLIDHNVQDGIIIGNIPGPYVIRGNQISYNGRHGYRQHSIARGYRGASREVILEGNDIFGNAMDGIHIGAGMNDAFLVGNRVRNNGQQDEPGTRGGGDTVTYTDTSLCDTAARWRPEGHRGKVLTVGAQDDAEYAVVLTNTTTELNLSPYRPGATTAWKHGTPPAGMPYSLPDPPGVRAGITLGAPTADLTIRGNRIWDNQDHKTQTHGLYIDDQGSCVRGRVADNDVDGNAVAAAHFATEPRGGYWERNHGLPPPPTGSS